MKNKIKKFKKEMDKPLNVDLKERFYTLIKKNKVQDMTDIDYRALFYRALFLDDTEREKFKGCLVLENMTKHEETKYRRVLPDSLFRKYFPSKEVLKNRN